MKRTYPRRPWSECEDEQLRVLYPKMGARIAEMLDRTPAAVWTHAKRLGVEHNNQTRPFRGLGAGRRALLRVGVGQLRGCVDDSARRILLGVGERREA